MHGARDCSLSACAGMFEILMSIPLALTVWKVVMGQDNIDFLQLVSGATQPLS